MDGVLIVDKPQGWTSHDVVDFIRKRFNVKKAGHAGTLDPLATGVLVLLIGSYTKRSDELSAHDKEYNATLLVGQRSDTGDSDGKIEAGGAITALTEESVRRACANFVGQGTQLPPMYSAVKMGGKKLYELARKGIAVEREPRPITITHLTITRIALPEVDFTVLCSKGTYVRQLCVDIGEALGCGAYLKALRRTRSGDFSIDAAHTIDELKSSTRAAVEKMLLSGGRPPRSHPASL